MSKTYNNEIVVDFTTGEVQGNKYMNYIDDVFDTLNKADAREAIKELFSKMLEAREADRKLVQEYDESLEKTYNAYMEMLNLLETLGLIKK